MARASAPTSSVPRTRVSPPAWQARRELAPLEMHGIRALDGRQRTPAPLAGGGNPYRPWFVLSRRKGYSAGARP